MHTPSAMGCVYICSSKHDGLAGTRFGWGLVKDANLAGDMLSAIIAISLSSSVDIELRVLNSMQAILSESDVWLCVQYSDVSSASVR